MYFFLQFFKNIRWRGTKLKNDEMMAKSFMYIIATHHTVIIATEASRLIFNEHIFFLEAKINVFCHDFLKLQQQQIRNQKNMRQWRRH